MCLHHCSLRDLAVGVQGCSCPHFPPPHPPSSLLGSVPCGWVRAGSEALAARSGCQNGSVFGLRVSVKRRRN